MKVSQLSMVVASLAASENLKANPEREVICLLDRVPRVWLFRMAGQAHDPPRLASHRRQLTEFGTHAGEPDARLRPDAFAWWFSRMRRDIDGILAASSLRVEFPSELAESTGDDT